MPFDDNNDIESHQGLINAIQLKVAFYDSIACKFKLLSPNLSMFAYALFYCVNSDTATTMCGTG